MTFQQLHAALSTFFLSLKLFHNKKLREGGREGPTDYSVQFIPGQWGQPLYEVAGLDSGSADFPRLMDFIIFSTTDITQLKFKVNRG